MTEMLVPSADGVRLAVSDIGPKDAPAFVFIHGWAQARLAWEAQAPLAEDFRLISFDLRGHGESDAPLVPEAYTDSQLWADDLAAVLQATAPVRPVAVGWSYGARVIGAYVQAYGTKGLAGIALAGGTVAMGAAREPWMAAPDSPGLNRALYTDCKPERDAATAAFVRACTATPLAPEFAARLMAANLKVPALVRRSLFKVDLDLRPIWRGFDKPALVVHGAEDTVVPPEVGEAAAAALPDAELHIYPATGHAPFIEHPVRFNADLRALAARVTP